MTTEITDTPRVDEAASRETFDSLNPRTGDIVGTHPVHTAEEVAATVARAKEAAAWWS
jgi:acyl-CoA reductase-like NAD-dependent aldehyde dehydrogenase